MITVLEYNVPSCDGIHTLKGVVYMPDGETRGYFHVVHGMTEHIRRYDKFMRDMAESGYISFGYDHLGHGYTANDDSELGYIARADGWDYLCRDVAQFAGAVRKEYGEMPYILMGHSMGSFIVRLAAERYVSPDKLIIMGTAGPNSIAGAGLALVALIKLLRGDRHISKLIDSVAFGGYNKRFGGGSESDPKPWLTNDTAVREKYYADKFCTFNFTVSAMGDLIRLIKYSNRGAWFSSLCEDMPILLVAGEDDPVGNYGKGVLEVEKRLKGCGYNVTCVIYKGARHEILNDNTYEDTKRDILQFCQ